MSRNVLLLPGDGIGPEIVAEAEKVLHKVNDQFGLGLGFESALVGGAAIDETDTPLPEDVTPLLELAAGEREWGLPCKFAACKFAASARAECPL